MKKIFTLFLLLISLTLFSQTKKYALIEHFSNTYCGICAASNPNFYSSIKVDNNANLHHISFHSRTPYVNCVFYQANKAPQDNRADYYGLNGTPRVSINGQSLTSVGGVTEAVITQNAGNNAVLSVKVTETSNATNNIVVKIKAFQNFSNTNHRLFVALVEKKINYNAPNGESTHYNVFRKFINVNNDEGETLTDIANGAEITKNYTYSIESGWNGSQIYAIAWVQNTSTKEVLNSGTRFDITSNIEEKPSVDTQVSVSPNPTNGKTNLIFEKLTPQYLTLTNAAGQVVINVKMSQSDSYEIDMAQLANGVYIAKIVAEEGIAIKKIVKE